MNSPQASSSPAPAPAPAAKGAAAPPGNAVATIIRRPAVPFKRRMLTVDGAGLIASVALVAAAYLAGVEPVINAHADVEQQRRLIEEQSRNAEDAERLLAAERAKLLELQRQLAATSVKLDPPSDINRRLAIISDLADRHGLSIQALDPGAPAADPAIGKFALVPIRLSGEGTFPDVARFLHELLSDQFADVEVRALNISAAPSMGSAALTRSTMQPGSSPSENTGPMPENPTAERASFALDLRWYAAPAASADATGRR